MRCRIFLLVIHILSHFGLFPCRTFRRRNEIHASPINYLLMSPIAPAAHRTCFALRRFRGSVRFQRPLSLHSLLALHV